MPHESIDKSQIYQNTLPHIEDDDTPLHRTNSSPRFERMLSYFVILSFTFYQMVGLLMTGWKLMCYLRLKNREMKICQMMNGI